MSGRLVSTGGTDYTERRRIAMKKKAKSSRPSPASIQPGYSPSPIRITIPVDQEAIIQYGDKQWRISQGRLRTLSERSSGSSSLSPRG